MADTCSTSRHPSEIVEMHILWRVWPLYGVLPDRTSRSALPSSAQDPDNRLVHAEVAGEQRRAAEFVGLARDVAHDATCLAHQQQAGGDIPRRQPVLEEGVVAAGRQEGEVERGGTPAPHAGGLPGHGLELAVIVGMVALADVGDAGGDEGTRRIL